MLRVEASGPILRLTLDRPEVRNALNRELIRSLRETFTSVTKETRVVVLSGGDETFCAGGDLNWMRESGQLSPDENRRDALGLARLFQAMVDCPAAVITRVAGPCFGGGCGLVAASDIALGTPKALFAFSEVKLGLVPATISPFVIPKIGASHARALFVTGEAFDATRALHIGLLHEVHALVDLDRVVEKKIEALLLAGPQAVAQSKKITQGAPLTLDESSALLARIRGGSEAQEGLAAFLEKAEAILGTGRGAHGGRRVIKKLLIANRGEIAVRIIRAAREMGIQTVAVFSDADADAMHTRMADEAVAIGPSEPRLSYLDFAKVIGAAKQTGADAVHPGYGFLSERAEFAQACAEAGFLFVGPSPEAMRKLGSKIEAKQLARAAKVPIVPGFFEPGASVSELKLAASEIGYPVMLKASAGGGGRGMRIVRGPDDFDAELNRASEEALQAFGDGAMMVEKLIERPHHVELQVLADHHGQVACLFERECSVQRRHQKLLEEAPSPLVGPKLDWDALKAAAENLVRAAGYTNAGTIETIVDPKTGEFYFLEVNARLQVEHPVTEAITGLDLVKWQLRIAQGERLDFDELTRSRINGHAIEARVIAEDPASGFLPSVGKIVGWAEPKAPGVRVDTGFGPGSEVSRFYDSLLAKVIAHGETRKDAIEKLSAALRDFHILGVKTNIGFLLSVLADQKFVAGQIDTGYVERELGEWAPPVAPLEVLQIAQTASKATVSARAEAESGPVGAWGLADGFRIVKAG